MYEASAKWLCYIVEFSRCDLHCTSITAVTAYTSPVHINFHLALPAQHRLLKASCFPYQFSIYTESCLSEDSQHALVTFESVN